MGRYRVTLVFVNFGNRPLYPLVMITNPSNPMHFYCFKFTVIGVGCPIIPLNSPSARPQQTPPLRIRNQIKLSYFIYFKVLVVSVSCIINHVQIRLKTFISSKWVESYFSATYRVWKWVLMIFKMQYLEMHNSWI